MELLGVLLWISLLAMPSSASWEESLLTKAILSQLDRNLSHVTRPSLGGSAVQVEMSVDLLDVRELSKKTAIGVFYVEEHYMWHEPRIQWEPSEFPGIRHLRLPARAVWKPDTFMLNGESLNPDMLSGHVTVTWDGHVTWSPRVIHHIKCSPTKPMSRRNRMPDWQCRLDYASKDFSEDEIGLMHASHDGVNISKTEENEEWSVKRTGVKKMGNQISYVLILQEVPYVREGEEDL